VKAGGKGGYDHPSQYLHVQSAMIADNLYINPQEDDSVALRHIPLIGLASETDRYAEVLKMFPISVQIKSYWVGVRDP